MEKFGVNVVYNTLEPYSRVMVEYGDRRILATVSDGRPNGDGVLELSGAAARMLEFPGDDEGPHRCTITPETKNYLIILLPYYSSVLFLGSLLGLLQYTGYLV